MRENYAARKVEISIKIQHNHKLDLIVKNALEIVFIAQHEQSIPSKNEKDFREQVS